MKNNFIAYLISLTIFGSVSAITTERASKLSSRADSLEEQIQSIKELVEQRTDELLEQIRDLKIKIKKAPITEPSQDQMEESLDQSYNPAFYGILGPEAHRSASVVVNPFD